MLNKRMDDGEKERLRKRAVELLKDRNQSKNKKYNCTGTGLAIAKRIVDQHNGKIWLKSELGKGSTFYFSIPK